MEDNSVKIKFIDIGNLINEKYSSEFLETIKKHYALQLIRSTLETMSLIKKPNDTAFLYSYLPYHLVELKSDLYLPVNRNYKPIGSSGIWVNYEDYSWLALPKHLINFEYLIKDNFLWTDNISPQISKDNVNKLIMRIKRTFSL